MNSNVILTNDNFYIETRTSDRIDPALAYGFDVRAKGNVAALVVFFVDYHDLEAMKFRFSIEQDEALKTAYWSIQ